MLVSSGGRLDNRRRSYPTQRSDGTIWFRTRQLSTNVHKTAVSGRLVVRSYFVEVRARKTDVNGPTTDVETWSCDLRGLQTRRTRSHYKNFVYGCHTVESPLRKHYYHWSAVTCK